MSALSSTQPWAAGQVTPRAAAVLAPNPGAMTLDGTNSWLLLEPGATQAVLVDPGPEDAAHLAAVLAAAEDRQARITRIVLTHGHPDHAAGAASLHAATGAPVLALDPRHRRGVAGLSDGAVLEVAGLELRVMATPGHTSDSLSLVLSADRAMLTGDTVLGRGTAVIAHPDGHLGSYLDSVDRMLAEVQDADLAWLLPGHGPARQQPAELLRAYREHRLARLARVRSARERGITDPEQLLEAAYPEVPERLRWAARLSLQAQVEYLAGQAGAAPAG